MKKGNVHIFPDDLANDDTDNSTASFCAMTQVLGLLTGEDGVSLPFVLLEQLLDHKISQVYDQQVHEII
ncbi:MAG: hypothetical protein MAG581_00985 [Deltaproteobacteria bacterium]|jgi:hypothetical protein|nr:hypothetical protein [Deltaproteobacteria bacterium]